jgi:diacylglycerol O-acyltransferase
LPFRAPRMGLGRVPTAHRVMACTSVALADVREISSRFGVTVNDVVLASLGGALRQVLVRRNELPEASLVAAVPVSVHDGDGFGLANALSLMFVSLGTQFDDPVARLDVVHQAAEQAKHLQGAIGPDAILAWLDAVWSPVVKGVARLYGGLQLAERLPPACNLLVSNIAGPPMPLYLGGARLVALYPFGPIYDGMALNITVLSCEGSLDFGLVACPESRLDVWDLAAAISDALAELGKATTPQRDSGIDEG